MENASKRRELTLDCAPEDEEDSNLDRDQREEDLDLNKQVDCDKHLISPYKRLRVDDLAHTSIESQCGEGEAHSLLRSRDDGLDSAQGSLLFMSDYDSSMAESSLPGFDVAKASQTNLSEGVCRREMFASSNPTDSFISSMEDNGSDQLKSPSRTDCPGNKVPNDGKYNQQSIRENQMFNGDGHEGSKDGASVGNKNMEEICMENTTNMAMRTKSFPGPLLLDRSGHENVTNLRPSTAYDSLLLASYHPDFQTLESREISLISPSEETKDNANVEQHISDSGRRVTPSDEGEKTSRAKSWLFQGSHTLSSQESVSSLSENLLPESSELITTNSDESTHSSVHSNHLTPLSPETASEYVEVCDQNPIVDISSMARPDGDGLETDIYVEMKSPLPTVTIPPLSGERPAAISRSVSHVHTRQHCPLSPPPEHIQDSYRLSENNASAIYDTLDFEVDGADNQATQELSAEAKLTTCIGVSTDDLNQAPSSTDPFSAHPLSHSEDNIRFHQATLHIHHHDQYHFDSLPLKSNQGTPSIPLTGSQLPATGSGRASAEVIFPHFISPNPLAPLSFSSSEDITFDIPYPQSHLQGPKSTSLNPRVSDSRSLSNVAQIRGSASSFLKSTSGYPNFEHEYLDPDAHIHFTPCGPELYQHYHQPLEFGHVDQGEVALLRQDLRVSSEGPSACLLPRDVRHRTRSIATSSSQDSTQSRNRLQDFDAEGEDNGVMDNSYPSSLAISSRKARRAVLQSSGHIKLAIYMNVGLLTVHVIKARNLSSSWSSRCDSYVKMSVVPDGSRRTRCKTAVSPNTNCPAFDQKFSIEILEEDKKKRLLISVWHKDTDNG